MRKVLRNEKKYLINYEEFIKYNSYFENILIADSHNSFFGYKVRSLYFDTLYDNDYNEKINGLYKRKKIRLRVYNPNDDFAYLEVKQKDGDYQMKRSLKMSKNDALEIIKCNYSVLLNYNDEFANECYTILTTKLYKPKAIVEYNRKAFIAKENNTRITFDSNIMANEINFNIFDDKLPLYPVFDINNVVLEVKYNGFLLSYIKDLINVINKNEISVSKYCLSRSIGLD